jgi:hypothetical protein
MKPTFFFLVNIICVVFSLNAQNYDPAAIKKYVEENKAYAIESMQLHKVPASITLAQGIFHTKLATNHLAKFANNHFSITCAKTDVDNRYHQDNNMQNICFRKYATVRDSYIDHGVYLSTKTHYKSLFSLDIYDYKAWATELHKLGYSITKNYAQNLINIIETYNLTQYDYPEQTPAEVETQIATVTEPTPSPAENNTTTEIQEIVILEQEVDTVETYFTEEDSEENLLEKPIFAYSQIVQKEKSKQAEELSVASTSKKTEETPTQKNEILFFSVNEGEQKLVRYPLSDRNVYEREGIKFIIAKAGDTFSNLAKELQFTENRLREYNDVYDSETELQVGEVVYLEMKNRKCNVDFHTIKYGETLRYIAQKYAIQLIIILKNNGESGYSLNEEICISCH